MTLYDYICFYYKDTTVKVYLFLKGQLITANMYVNQNTFDWPRILLKSKYSTQLFAVLWFTGPSGT